MSSNFWLDSEDEWDDEIYSGDEESDKEEVKPVSKFADLDMDDDDEDAKRVTKSASEKSWDELTKSIKLIKNKMFINDWNTVADEWEALKKVVVKSDPVFSREGIPRFLTSFLIELEDRVNEMFADKAFKKSASPTNAKSLNMMKQGVKKWLASNESQAERVKAFRENPKLAEEEDVKPAAKPVGGARKSEGSAAKAAAGDEDDEMDEEEAKQKVRLVGRAKWLKKNKDDDSSSESGSEDDDDDWLDDDDDEDNTSAAAGGGEDDGDISALAKKSSTSAATDADDDESDDDDDENDEDGKKKKKKNKKNANKKPQEEKKEEEWTPEKIDAKLKEIVARRGTKNYDRVKQVVLFAFLYERAKEKAPTGERLLRILFAVIDALFDVNQNMYAHMNVKVWKYAYNTIVKVFELMHQYADSVQVVEFDPEVVVVPAVTTGTSSKKSKDSKDAAISAATASTTTTTTTTTTASLNEDGLVQVRGLILSQIERLDEEYFKSLQLMDPHTQEYVARMRHESALLKLLKIGFDYFEARGETQKAASLAARRLDHLYYRRETEGASQRAAFREAQRQMVSQAQDAEMERDQKQNDDSLRDSSDSVATAATDISTVSTLGEIPDDEIVLPSNNAGILAAKKKNSGNFVSSTATANGEELPLIELVPHLCSLVYASNDERQRIKAVLQHIYHLALHDKYFEARDRLLATRMQDEIANAPDVPMQIAYNRALVQLGLAAFRKGRIADAHNALNDIVGARVKELLAQGLNIKNIDRTAEQEKLEKRRQMPYPMHINLDLIEFAHLTSAMLLEIPMMAAKPGQQDMRKRNQMKTFRKILEMSERQTFTGPPENTKDHVIAAAKALAVSDWQRASDLLLGLDIWKLIPKADEVKVSLKRKIQEEALRTHLFSNAQFYETISLSQLVDTFQLPKHSVHAIVSKMMIHDELAASWDQPSESIVLNSAASPSPLQNLALLYADRISSLFSDSDDSRQGGNQQQQGGQGQGGNQSQNNNGQQQSSGLGGQNSGNNGQQSSGQSSSQSGYNKHSGDKRGGQKGGNQRGGNNNNNNNNSSRGSNNNNKGGKKRN